MPRIASGLDRLNWNKVKEIIKEVFGDMNCDILVCYMGKETTKEDDQ